MSALAVGIIAAVVGALLTWGATALPGVRQGREYKRQLHQTIIGVPAAPGVEARPALVDRVVDVEVAINAVGATVTEGITAASAAAEEAIKVAQALPRIEASVDELKESHVDLSARLHDHMQSEEAAITDLRAATQERQIAVQASIDGVHAALAEHAESDLRVAEEIRTIATEANGHAAAARKAAEAGAAASQVAADIDQQVLAGQVETHKGIAAISTAVGVAEAEADEEYQVEPPPSRRRRV